MQFTTKLLILIVAFICTMIGFMVKLPTVFRAHDKMLHAAFYFLAAAFLHLLFQKRVLLILGILLVFGICIEYLQEYSNKFTGKRIHGRFDIEDVYANSKGLAAYLLLWLFFITIRSFFNLLQPAKKTTE